jgi:hypothetical protein
MERTPATERELAGRAENPAKVGECRNRIVEAHDTEPREHGICGPGRTVQGLSVGLDQFDLTECHGPAPDDVKQQRRNVHADYSPSRPDPPRELEKRLPGPAADIEDGIPRSRVQSFDGRQPQGRKLKVDELASLGPRFIAERAW